VRKKDSGQVVAKHKKTVLIPREQRKQIKVTVPMKNAHLWSPKDPFLYTYEIKLYDHGKVSDDTTAEFGMRDFKRIGKHFYLNGK
jgi:beta-galactosidase/beta-glucuronidase